MTARVRALGRQDAAAATGVAVAAVGFARAFRGARGRFWNRMTLTGAVLGTIAVLADPATTVPRWRARDVVTGLAAASALYGVFAAGDRLARRIVPTGAADIDAVYELRAERRPAELAARLAVVIGPAEELFWRGLLQGVLVRRFGRWRGAALATAGYAGVHVASGNLT
ncbi:MAG: CPBP family intramembrane metalloprotease, partial [Chloroflexota bacterium]|nr:CPBP family intramembrane metalloprotease [Chloroflexota bacterium]